MSEPFIGQITPYAFNFAPRNYAQCNGQIMNLQQNQALFALLGTRYGGNGTTQFQLPNLMGRTPVVYGAFAGESYPLGSTGGLEGVTLTQAQLPQHSHLLTASGTLGNSRNPRNNQLGQSGVPIYAAASSPTVQLAEQTVTEAGANAAHENRQPYLALNFCIALFGIYPSRN